MNSTAQKVSLIFFWFLDFDWKFPACVYLISRLYRLDVSSGQNGEEDSAFSDSVEDETENLENIGGIYIIFFFNLK